MTVLDQLEQVTAEEHSALVRGDWPALQGCVELKNTLASRVSSLDLDKASAQQARRLSDATRYNLELASRLSRELGELLSCQQREPTYNQRGRLSRRALAVMSLEC